MFNGINRNERVKVRNETSVAEPKRRIRIKTYMYRINLTMQEHDNQTAWMRKLFSAYIVCISISHFFDGLTDRYMDIVLI